MCTLALLLGVHADFPVIVAANRDEFYAREATGPALLDASTGAVGGRDLRGGGTWLGANAHGVFVGLTNQRTWHGPAEGKRSRGEVPLGVLACRSTDEADAYLHTLDAREYNEFNLVFGDARGLRCAYARSDQATLRFEDVPRGVHALPNEVLDAPSFAKAERARTLITAQVLGEVERRASIDELVSPLRAVLASHTRAPLDQVPEPPPGSLFSRELVHELDAVCIHTPVYGTCSSTIVALAPGRVAHYLFAAGPPCTTPFEDFTALFPA